MIESTEELQKLAGDFFAGNAKKDNPFQEVDGVIYLHYNSLIIQNSADGDGVQIGFKWGVKALVWLPMPKVRIENNDIINLLGIEGRQKIDFQ